MEIAMEVPQFQSFWAWKVRRCCKDAPIQLPHPLSRQNAESFCKDLEQSLEAPIRINRWGFTQNRWNMGRIIGTRDHEIYWGMNQLEIAEPTVYLHTYTYIYYYTYMHAYIHTYIYIYIYVYYEWLSVPGYRPQKMIRFMAISPAVLGIKWI